MMPPITPSTCALCGRPATAVWHGDTGTTLAICPACAVDLLPALTADAVYIGDRSAVERTADRMAAAYWHAMTIRLLRDRDAAREGAA